MLKHTLNLILVGLIVLIFGNPIIAISNDSLAVDKQLTAPQAGPNNNADNNLSNNTSNDNANDSNTITWPMLPDESLKDIAHLFYPKNPAMQQQFLRKTLRLNHENQPTLQEDQRFTAPTLLVIPTLKSLSQNANSVYVKHRTVKKQKLQMSYHIKQAVEGVPAALLAEYELLVTKNAFLKEQLAKLNEKLGFLQTKLNEMKLILDKTLTLPHANLSNVTISNSPQTSEAATMAIASVATALAQQTPPAVATALSSPDQNMPATTPPIKKIFKNLDNKKAVNVDHADIVQQAPKPVPASLEQVSVVDSLMDMFNTNIVLLILALGLIAVLSSYLLKKYRQNMFSKFTQSMPKMDDTVIDFSGNWQDTELESQPEKAFESAALSTQQTLVLNDDGEEAKELNAKNAANTAPNNDAQNKQSKNDNPEINLDSTLEEAKLLMSINRNSDAIAHLKMTIKEHPKLSINHWLYLLEIFRKLNLKDEFEQYAKGLHHNFNVTTQNWDDTIAPAIMPQYLEDFPNIMEKLYPLWPNESAKVYLRSLIIDSRDGARVGFGKAVLSEILLLIMLQETRKDFD